MVLAPGKHSPSRNRLLSVLSDGDFALLQPHLRPVALPLLYDLERPNRKIEMVYFMETGIASIVAVQSDGTRVEVGLCWPRGDERRSRGAWRRPIAAFDLHPGRGGRAADQRQ